MKAFLGVRSFAVNQQTQAPLRNDISKLFNQRKAQMTYFKEIGFVPSNKNYKQTKKLHKILLQKLS